MPDRLDRPITLLCAMTGPIKLGKFDDGTIIAAGPNDEPVLIRDGRVMEKTEHRDNGDLVFCFKDRPVQR